MKQHRHALFLPPEQAPGYRFPVDRGIRLGADQSPDQLSTTLFQRTVRRYNVQKQRNERYAGFEPAPSVWKTDVLTVEH